MTSPEQTKLPFMAPPPSSADKRLTVEDLSPDQRVVFDAIWEWFQGNPDVGRGDSKLLTCGGWAGTGKSSILGVLASRLAAEGYTVAYCAFTGRAASVLARKLRACGVECTSGLRRKGDVDPDGPVGFYDSSLKKSRGGPPFCGTFHKLLYIPAIDPETHELKGWGKRSALDRRYDLIVVDEASMVSADMLEDLRVHDVPILAVGDHGQLPPVMSSGSVVEKPDLLLEKIHRQALDNPIIKLARNVRRDPRAPGVGGPGQSARTDYGSLAARYEDGQRIIYGDKADFKSIYHRARIEGAVRGGTALDVGVLCWMNKTRVKLNAECRAAEGYDGPPKRGEPVICLKNMALVYNGMRGLVLEDAREREHPLGPAAGVLEGKLHDPPTPPVKDWLVDAKIAFPEEGLPAAQYELCGPQFFREKVFAEVEELRAEGIDVYSMKMAGAFFDFGYALTCHKSQGSSFDHVIVYLDRPEKPHDPDWRRWIYTAITRSSWKLTVLF